MAYDHPHGLIAYAVIVQLLVIGIVLSRFWSRKKHGNQFFIADWLILVACVLSTALAIDMIYGAATGVFGVRITPLLRANPRAALALQSELVKHNTAFQAISIVGIGLVKISASCFYLQVFGTRTWFRPVIQAWIVLMIMWTAGFLIAFLSICGNHGTIASVNPRFYAQYCPGLGPMNLGLVYSGVITDFITVVLPIPVILSLHMPLRRRLSIVAIFLIGLLTVGASIARTYISVTTSRAVYNANTMDQGLGVTAILVWALVEMQVGTIAACGPTIRPLLHEIAHSQAVESLISSAKSIVSGRGSQSSLDTSGLQSKTSKSQMAQNQSAQSITTASAGRKYTSDEITDDGIHVEREFEVTSGTNAV